MPIAGFSFTKIYGERKGAPDKQEKIYNNVKITNINEGKIMMGQDGAKDALNISFEFSVDYGKAGKVELLGSIIYHEAQQKVKSLLDGWNKDKKVPPEFVALIYNFIFSKANVKSLQLEEEVGLPLHLKLPRLKVK